MADATPPEGLSKNALKKWQKQQDAAKKKAAKKAEQAAKGVVQGPGKKKEEEELDPTKYFENRSKQITDLEAAGKVMYPHKFQVDFSNMK
jgi:lysyl-tRNA synthetase class 2